MQVSGALLVDKPSGQTSFDVIRALKRKFGIKKIGHSGTLDPLATGLLIVLVGEGTRLQSVLLESEKEYEGTFRLGIKTATDDLAGQIIERDEIQSFRERPVEHLCREIGEKFSGKILQRPPEFSAIKKDGVRSYKRARQGEAVELPLREVEIYSLEVKFLEPDLLSYRVRCSKGTYVRSLARDIGEFLGSVGCVESLRRTSSAGFDIKDALTLEQLLETHAAELPILTLAQLVKGLPTVIFADEIVSDLLAGRQAAIKGLSVKARGLYALWSESGRFSGLLEAVDTEPGKIGLRIRFLRPISEQ